MNASRALDVSASRTLKFSLDIGTAVIEALPVNSVLSPMSVVSSCGPEQTLTEKPQGLCVDPTCLRKSAAPLGGGHIASFIPMRIRDPVEELS